MADRDSPWKELLDHHLQPALAFLFPDVAEDVDWAHEQESLEQELRKMAPAAETGKRVADKLVKVRSRSGDDRYLHVEVQGQPQEGFPRRVYVYSYRGDDRFGVPVESLVILADDDPGWRPTQYEVRLKRTRLTFDFEPVKVLDWRGREVELLRHENPVGLFLLSHLESRRTHNDPDERARVKLGLIQRLAEKRLDADDLRLWYRLLDWFLDLPAGVEKRVWQEVARLQQEKKMPFVTFADRYEREQGKREGLLVGLEALLESKFGAAGLGLAPALRQIEGLDPLQAVLQAAKQPTASLDDVRKLLPDGAPATGDPAG